ncbi:MAG: YceI family protein [Verrucomicrobiae bacterium]|nr:YceI family protein [Verrucomicrobiae bacterium]
MTRTFLHSFASPALLASLLAGWCLLFPNAGFTEDWDGTCDVTFKGDSTLHDFEGTVTTKPFTVTISGIDQPATAAVSSKITAEAKKMDTDNDKRDEKMYETLEVGTYPEIEVEVTNLKAAETKPVSENGFPRPTIIPFVLKLKGKEHHLTGKVTDWKHDADTIDCTVAFVVSLKAADIKPPSVLGLVKVKDEIDVAAHLKLSKH